MYRRHRFWALLLSILMTVVLFSSNGDMLGNVATVQAVETGSQLAVHFIDVGQGDATLITCDGHSLLIDAGNNDKGTTVQLYLQKQGISSLDAVIWTHPDADHIGGADVITTKFDIGTTYMPNVTANTRTYEDLINAINYKGYKITVPTAGSSFMLGSATVTFLNSGKTYSDDNNNSLICMVQLGNNKFLFTGDAETEAEADLVNNYANVISADVYKVGHHGSRTSTSLSLLNAVNPGYAVISCGEGNSYGHPTADALNNLRSKGVNVYRTDEQGSIIAISDGTNITWNALPSTTWKAGEASASSVAKQETTVDTPSTSNSTTASTATGSYIGNKNNKKLHKSSCKTLPADKNQVPFNSLEEAQNAGYTKDNQCKNCYPYGK